MQADEQGVIVIPSPHFFPNRYGNKPRYVIVHGTASPGPAVNIGHFFQGSVQAATHYIVDKDGTVVQCVEEKDGAWSNGGITGPSGTAGDGVHHDSWWSDVWKDSSGDPLNPNLITISIEHVKNASDNSDQLTAPQEEASFKLIKDICERNSIPMKVADAKGGITGHFSMDPVNRSRCPGPYPWDRLWTFLGADQSMDITNPIIASLFDKVSDTEWKCKKTGKSIHDGILNFYKNVPGPLGGYGVYRLPITDEWYPHPGVAMQRFEGGVLCWDPSHVNDNPPGFTNVYPAKIYEGASIDPRLDIALQQLTTTQSQLKDSQAQVSTLKTELDKGTTTLDQQMKDAILGLKPIFDKITVAEAPTVMTPVAPPATPKVEETTL